MPQRTDPYIERITDALLDYVDEREAARILREAGEEAERSRVSFRVIMDARMSQLEAENVNTLGVAL